MHRFRTFVMVLCLLPMLLVAAGPVAAQATEREKAFVYGMNAALGDGFIGSFAPPSVDTIYLLADQTSILSPRMTEIYFWPITNQYQASWETLNEPVPGTLEILQNGQVITQTTPTSYTLQTTQQGKQSRTELFLGAEAEAAQQDFVDRQQAYAQAQSDYLKAQEAWITAVDDANKRSQAGEKVTPPPEPQPPEPIGIVSNGLNHGIPVNLPAGSYQIRLRNADGTIQPGSERNLEVFAPRRTVVGYTVMPETRWTTPEANDDPAGLILGQPHSQLYLVPHTAMEYPARAYALLQEPQQPVGENSEWTWVTGDPITSGKLEILSDQQVRQELDFTPYKVQQSQGTDLGYQVQPFVPNPARPDAAPDFSGYPVQLDQPGRSFQVRIVAPDGTVMPGSTRLVHTPAEPPIGWLLLLSALPLALGAVVIIRRRRRMRLPRNIAG